MPNDQLDIVILGLSLTSSWGNGHATTYRSLLRALSRRGHRILFLERDAPWYAQNRDLPEPEFCQVGIYGSVEELKDTYASQIEHADLVIVGSFVPDGAAVAQWVLDTTRGRKVFYDIDTPSTLAAVTAGNCGYMTAALIPRFDLYLSFTGGSTLTRLEREFSAQRARALYCSVDPDLYFPDLPASSTTWDLGYLGTYSADRQPTLQSLLIDPARQRPRRRFVVAGPMYPESVVWPGNVTRVTHVSPSEHRRFYCQMRFTLNVTRADMVAVGYAPSVRLFEAAACAIPIISDVWPGLDRLFTPGREILLARTAADTLRALEQLGEAHGRRVGLAARKRVLAAHTALHRAVELEEFFDEAVVQRPHWTGAALEAEPQAAQPQA